MSLRRRLLFGLVTIGAVLVVSNLTLAARYRSFLLERVDRQLVDVASRPVFRGGPRGGPVRCGPDERTLSEYFIACGDPATGQLRTAPSALADETN
jgi:hypothetical protein